jgi:small GTP-binding protein
VHACTYTTVLFVFRYFKCRFVKGEFTEEYATTCGMEFSTKSLPFERCNLNAQIWDVSGKERGTKKNTQFFKDAVGAILVYDITNRQSFENLKNVWLKQVQEFGHANIKVMLIGNKLDRKEARQVEIDEAIEFAKMNQMVGFIEASAMNGECVNIGFRRVICLVGSILPSVKVHLDQLGLPFGWRIARSQLREAEENSLGSTGTLSVNDVVQSSAPRASARKKENDYIHTYTNYWTDESTLTMPTRPAQHHLLYVPTPPAPSPMASVSGSPRNSTSELKPLNFSSSPGDGGSSSEDEVAVKPGGCCVVS